MSNQYNKVLKRQRHDRYLKRKKARAKSPARPQQPAPASEAVATQAQ